ncbi:MAG: STAS domain-containing protein [Planctomycetales bacterium]
MTSRESPYRFESGDGYGLVVLLPALNECPWSDIEKIGSEILDGLKMANYRGLLVDLSPLEYMGSAMVALVVRLWKSVKQQNKSMVVVNRDPMVLEVLQLAGLHKIWTIVETREEGFRELGVAGQRGGGPPGAAQGVAVLAVGMAAAVGAVAGLGLLLSRTEAVPAAVSVGITLGCALLALVAGSVITVRDREPGRRIMGVVMVVAGLASILVGILNIPGRTPPPAEPGAKAVAPDTTAAAPKAE